MAGCGRCETLPEHPQNQSLFYMALPVTLLTEKLRNALLEEGACFREVTATLFAVKLEEGLLPKMAQRFLKIFNKIELRDIKCAILHDGNSLRIQDILKAETLGTLVARMEAVWLIDILRKERLYSVFQPIVYASQPENVFAHEVLLRGMNEDGSIVSPGRMFAAAKDADLLFFLDRTARIQAIRSAHEYQVAGNLFINFSPAAIYDPSHCLGSTLSVLKDAGMKYERIVFEVVESEHIQDSKHLVNLINFYRESGFSVALDDVGSGYSSLNLLAELKPDFMKIDLYLIRDVDKDAYKQRIVAKLLEAAQQLGIRSVAEGVESFEEYEWLREHGADLVQGYLFAKPACPPLAPSRIVKVR